MRLFSSGNHGIVVVITLVSAVHPSFGSTITSTLHTTRIHTPTPSTGTCESRTVNYITHSLPSVCLRNGRSGAPWGTSGDRTPSLTTLSPSATDVHGENAAPNVLTSVITLSTASTIDLLSTNTTSTTSPSSQDDDGESLDEASFLSFEEWKRKTQEQAGQEGERKRKDGETLESAKVDGEIDMDIHAIIGDHHAKPHPTTTKNGNALEKGGGGHDVHEISEKRRFRGKDAGKTCKERFNFASVDAGGQVMKANPEAKSSSAILSENRDYYMLNICSAENKFVIVELSDAIYVETVALANFEFFSSTFRQFQVSVSAKYPVKADKWKALGTFEAQNTRDIQAFLVESPLIEARYLRIEFLNHYGNEFYCPLSLLRVHGQTALQEVMSWERAASGEDDDDEAEDPEVTNVAQAAAAAEAEVQQYQPSAKDEIMHSETTSEESQPAMTSSTTDQVGNTIVDRREKKIQKWLEEALLSDTTPWEKPGTEVSDLFEHPTSSTCRIYENPITRRETSTSAASSIASPTAASAAQTSTGANSSLSAVERMPNTTQTQRDIAETNSESVPTTSTVVNGSSTSMRAVSPSATLSNQEASQEPISTSTKPISVTSSQTNTKPVKTSAGQPAQPATQESFFKTVTKRLQLLETNSTLSLKYIEQQSKYLREAFNKVEKRQVSKTTSFLENLNSTVIAELRKFGQEYDQMWQSTVIELESQREHSKRETAAVTARLNMLADELVFQKRMAIVQSVLLLLCLALVVFSRGVAGGYIDMPALQNMLAKSTRSRSMIGFGSPGSNLQLRRSGSYRNNYQWDGGEYEQVRSDDSDYVRSREVSPPAAYDVRSTIDESRGSTPHELLSTESMTGDMDSTHDDEGVNPSENFRSQEVHMSPKAIMKNQASPRTVQSVSSKANIIQQKPNNVARNAAQNQIRHHNELTPQRKRSGAKKAAKRAKQSYLPSPPPENEAEKTDFTIARKPLPALPVD